jgi:transcriptional regulator with XRE-family HTH domain
MAKSFDELVMRTTTKEVRERARHRTEELLGEMLLAELRKAHKVSQNQLARAMGIRQPSLSKLEKQTDMQVSTLQKLVNALGGTVEVSARFGDKTVTLRNFSGRAFAGKRFKRKAPEARPRTHPKRAGTARVR